MLCVSMPGKRITDLFVVRLIKEVTLSPHHVEVDGRKNERLVASNAVCESDDAPPLGKHAGTIL